MAQELALKFAVIFRRLVKGCTFLACWRLADVVPVKKEFSSSDVEDYRPIAITIILSKVFEKFLAKKLDYFLESNSLLLLPSFRI